MMPVYKLLEIFKKFLTKIYCKSVAYNLENYEIIFQLISVIILMYSPIFIYYYFDTFMITVQHSF